MASTPLTAWHCATEEDNAYVTVWRVIKLEHVQYLHIGYGLLPKKVTQNLTD